MRIIERGCSGSGIEGTFSVLMFVYNLIIMIKFSSQIIDLTATESIAVIGLSSLTGRLKVQPT